MTPPLRESILTLAAIFFLRVINLRFVGRVAVRLKAGVLDAEGKNVEKALGLLNVPVESVSFIKTYEIVLERDSLKEAEQAVEEASRRLLANPVVHDYTVKLEAV